MKGLHCAFGAKIYEPEWLKGEFGQSSAIFEFWRVRDHSTRARDHLGGARPLQRCFPLQKYTRTTTPRVRDHSKEGRDHSFCLHKNSPKLKLSLKFARGFYKVCLYYQVLNCVMDSKEMYGHVLSCKKSMKNKLNDRLSLQAYAMMYCWFFKVLYSLFPSICFPILNHKC